MAWISVGVLGPRTARDGVARGPKMTVWMHNPDHAANVAAGKVSLPFHWLADRKWAPVEFLPLWKWWA